MTAEDVARRLPDPATLERLSLSIAALDAVLSPEWDFRFFSYDREWSPGQRLASMRDGSGNDYRMLFSDDAAVVRAFDHESDLSPWGRDDGSLIPGLLDRYPDSLRFFIDEAAFRTPGAPGADLTFCAWRLAGPGPWLVGSIEDDGGAAELLDVVLDGTAHGYRRYAIDYFEVDPGVEVINAFLTLHPADPAVVTRLNPEADPVETLAELRSMGYPVAT